MSKKFKFISSICLGSLLIVSLIISLNYYFIFKAPNINKDTVVLIYKKYTYEQVMNSLKVSGAFKNFKRFQKAANKKDLSIHIEAGRYILKEGMSNQDVIRHLANGWQSPGKLILSGYIRNIDKLALVLSKQLEADSSTFSYILKDSSFIDSLGFNKTSLLGMFIPNTYEVYWTTSPKDIIKRFAKEYESFWNNDRLTKASMLHLSPKEISTLAAIVAEESHYAPEQPTIAGVYLNRLKTGMKLQADPTVRYIAIENEPNINRILKKHLRLKSPYNTYIYRGLPPGPISIPSISAIDAVLNYENHNYLYFCAKHTLDGTHHFSSSYSQHLKYARAYQREITKLQREKATK